MISVTAEEIEASMMSPEEIARCERLKFVDYESRFPEPYPMPENPGDPKPYRIVAADHMLTYDRPIVPNTGMSSFLHAVRALRECLEGSL